MNATNVTVSRFFRAIFSNAMNFSASEALHLNPIVMPFSARLVLSAVTSKAPRLFRGNFFKKFAIAIQPSPAWTEIRLLSSVAGV